MLLKKIDLLSDLNPNQRLAVEYFDTNLRVIAGPGTGKTKVITRKIAMLVNDLNVNPESILALTFTNRACNEMKQRVIRNTHPHKNKHIKIQTFHSFCLNVLRIYYKNIGYKNNFSIIDDKVKNKMLGEIYDNLKIQRQEIELKDVAYKISWAKTYDLDPAYLAQRLNIPIDSHLIKIYTSYQNELYINQAMDWDDLITQTNRLFKENPEIATKYGSKFKYILIDEFQDTTDKEFEIIKSILQEDTHFTIVGDPDQTIYQWRGANIHLILNFDKEFPNSKTVILNQNYRSTPNILNAATKFIKNNTIRYSKELFTENPNGSEIEFYYGFSPEAEARWVVQKINQLKKEKTQLKNIAVMYRSKYYSRSLEEALLQNNINHKVLHGTKFFDREEIKTAIAFLSVLVEKRDLALEQVINIPSRQIGPVTLNKIKEFGRIQKQKDLYRTLFEDYRELPIGTDKIQKYIFPFLQKIIMYQNALKKYSISTVLDKFLEEIGYYKFINGNENLRGTAIDNVKELINSIKSWEQDDANKNKTAKDYLDMVAAFTLDDDGYDDSNYVSLMTAHASKGLEFDNVFIIGLSEDIFPSKKSLYSPLYVDEDMNTRIISALEEERRLMYVAITRAKKQLFISDSRGKLIGTDNNKVPSRFIEEMGIDLESTILLNDFSVNNVDDEDALRANYVPGDIISHIIFGEGKVLEVLQNEIIVYFVKDKSTKTLNKNHTSIQIISNK
ncbi:ATP-dependent helicase [Mycoplasma corogypsi]|uniref:ATP-dependent helicase n=1 Tax=Mycoplasma corogypsi TaxID=2106 RepID=UPI0038735E9B